MNTAKIKTWALVIGVGAVAIAGTWLYSSSALTPAVAQVASSGCGPDDPATFGVPLELLAETAGGVVFEAGPFATADLPGPLRIVFDPAMSGTEREITMLGDTIALPTTYGRSAAVPERINITCKDGAITTVRYTGGRSSATNFNVTLAEAAVIEAVPGVVEEDPVVEN
jgi:hypothetical protein